MTECPICKGRGTVGYFHIDHFVDIECDRCNGSGEVSEVQMTNEEWFCQLSTEEKADLLFGTFYLAGRNDEKIGDWEGVDTIMEWLKQPHREE